MLSEMGRRPVIGNSDGSYGDELEKELGLILREQRRQETDDFEKELNLYRSGSAPPTVEGSLSAVGGLFGHGGGNAFSGVSANEFVSEEDVRSDPAYLKYYYSKVNMNPRLPPPLLSKEDWRSSQRVNGGGGGPSLGGIGDRRKVNRAPENVGGRSAFAMPPGFNSRKDEGEMAQQENLNASTEWGNDGLIGISGLGLGSKQTSLADIFQNDMGRASPVPNHPSRPVSRNDFTENADNLGSSAVHSMGPPASYSYAAVVGGSVSRSTTPDPQLIARAPSPAITPIGRDRNLISEKRSANSPGLFNGIGTNFNESADLVAALSGMSLSANSAADEKKQHRPSQIEQEVNNMHNNLFNSKQHSYLNKSENNNSGGWPDHRNTLMMTDMQSYMKGPSTSNLNSGSGLSSHYNQQADTPKFSYQNYGLDGYAMNQSVASMMASQLGKGTLPPLYENLAAASALNAAGMDARMLGGGLASESHNLNRMGNLQSPYMDPSYLQYLRTAEFAAAQVAALNDPTQMDLAGLQKAYMGNLLSTQKSQYGGKATSFNHQGYYVNPAYGVGMQYPGSPLASPHFPNSSVGPGSPMRHNDMGMSFPSGIRNLSGGLAPWHLDSGYSMNESFASSLLEEFKGNKTKCFELAEIAGHVVEFSADQYGSRFIQQKLETATTEEKNMVYQEIFPQALSLMTDVFGNYVVQKFFEHGMPNQRRELACKLYGHVLTLSLQMYGCRVIQKAIEVVDMDQKIKMVEELEGHIIRCVRDQNGNHVIQKCIECVPEEYIQFIITTFFDQVVTLSTHPYGCRVIQRVLEHCDDPHTQNKVMTEVLGAVSMLAQDQYGNYVVQHVLEHGKPEERSIIIKELAGNIVQMSQQKFASNVVEKCLTFGDPSERQLLVVEMLGTTDENEPLQAMMKDQFANYVVQKVLETCEDQQRELILTRIKIHLNALKKYTYGKHIVARVEKLVAAGERRIASQNQHSA